MKVYTVRHAAFMGGMGYAPIECGDDLESARCMAAAILRKARRSGHLISILTPGREWEISDRGYVVDPSCGILDIVERDVPLCACCGTPMSVGKMYHVGAAWCCSLQCSEKLMKEDEL